MGHIKEDTALARKKKKIVMANIKKKHIILGIIALVIIAAVFLVFYDETQENTREYEASPFWNEIINDNEVEIKEQKIKKSLEEDPGEAPVE
jgi:cell division protein ZapA (FtsZ GTPase activity inhibitor)